jgi:hypothetical protein
MNEKEKNDLTISLPTILLHYLLSGYYTERLISILVPKKLKIFFSHLQLLISISRTVNHYCAHLIYPV